MIRNVWCVMCNMVITDQETGSASYIQCLESGGSPVIPASFPALSVGSFWEKVDNDQPEKVSVRIIFVAPSGSESVIFATGPVEVSRPLQKMNFHLPGIQTNEYGRHELRVEFEQPGASWRVAAILPLFIYHAAAPQGPGLPHKPVMDA